MIGQVSAHQSIFQLYPLLSERGNLGSICRKHVSVEFRSNPETLSSVTVQQRKRSSALLWRHEKSQSKLIWKEAKQTQTHPNPLRPAARHKSAKGSGKYGGDSRYTPRLFCYLSLSVIGLLSGGRDDRATKRLYAS